MIMGSAIIAGAVGIGAVLGTDMAHPSGAHPLASTNPAAASTMDSHKAMGSMAGTHVPAAKSAQAPVLRLHQRVVHLTIHNFAFQPARLVVSPGTRLIWTNQDSDPHTVDNTKGVWTSEALDPAGGQFARVFSKVGAFPYYCSIHPFMHGTIIVQK